MISWLKRIFFKDLDNIKKDLKETKLQLAHMKKEMSAQSFVIQKQAELIAALASVQAEILSSMEFEYTLEELGEELDNTVLKKVVFPLGDPDDDIFH